MKIIFDPKERVACEIRQATYSGYSPSNFALQLTESRGDELKRSLTARLMSWTLVEDCRHEPRRLETEWLVEE